MGKDLTNFKDYSAGRPGVSKTFKAIDEKFSDLVMENQAASTATDVAGLKTDLNALLTKLKAAGLMAADS